MNSHTDFDPQKRTGTLTLRGVCATEDAASLAQALRELVDGIETAKAAPGPGGDAEAPPWAAALDMSGLSAVGMAFFEVVFAAWLALSQRGTVLSRHGPQPDCVRQAAKLTGFAAVPGLSALFSGA